ncbi:MAG: hypothetical protein ACLUHG_00810 [Sutterella wadsworthensis]
MDRRSFITGLAAGTAALAHTGLACATSKPSPRRRVRHHEPHRRSDERRVEVIDIKGVRIGEGRQAHCTDDLRRSRRCHGEEVCGHARAQRDRGPHRLPRQD